MASKTQELQQKVCQRFGWSLVYTKLEDSRWKAEVVTGLLVSDGKEDNHKHTFITGESYEEDKEGKYEVSKLALEGLAEDIAAREALPAMELTQVFASTLKDLPILDSQDPATWERFWNNPPNVVGIDTEGNKISPPVLVQIATMDYVILETPQKSLSDDLVRLLKDDNIAKVFCDNFAHKDKVCLGLSVEKDPLAHTKPPIVDLESLSMKSLGPVKTARGLGRIVALTMPELGVRIEKPKVAKQGMKARFKNIARFAMIEQGKQKPLRGLSDLRQREQQYAALDAWCTLMVYTRIPSQQ